MKKENALIHADKQKKSKKKNIALLLIDVLTSLMPASWDLFSIDEQEFWTKHRLVCIFNCFDDFLIQNLSYMSTV